VVIDNFDVVGVSVPPFKADPELVVDSDTVLAFPVTFEGFEPEAGQFEIPERRGRVQEFQSDPSCLFNAVKLSTEVPIQQQLHILLAAGSDHTTTILRRAYSQANS
jgi:hypothetical protein